MDVRYLLLDAVQEAVQSSAKVRQRAAVKRAIAYLWGLLPADERRAFLMRVSAAEPFELVGWSPRFPRKDDPKRSRVEPEVEEAARNWGQIMGELGRSDLEQAKKVQKIIRIRRTPTPTMQAFMKLKLHEMQRRMGNQSERGEG